MRNRKKKNLSILGQLIIYFLCISLILGAIAFFVLRFNNTVLKSNSRYLTYISNINALYELQDKNKDILYEIEKGTDNAKEKELTQNIELSNQYLEDLEKGYTTRDTKLRIRTVKYLVKRFESHSKEMIWLRDYESNMASVTDTTDDESASHSKYLETLDISNRINLYLQDILRYSVDENQEFIQQSIYNSKYLQGLILSFFVLLFLVSIGFYFVFAKYASRLIKHIMSITEGISKGGKKQEIIALDGPKEIQELTTQFNNLLKTIYRLNKESEEKSKLELRLIEEEKHKADLKLQLAKEELEQIKVREKLKEAQLHGLQMQIQPHFLFNTLNIISMTALLENANNVYELLLAFSKFLRHYLKKASQNVSVEEELEMISQYLTILKARMGEQLEYKVILNGDISKVSDIKIPMFTLQPIVENAFKHGIEKLIKKGFIIVRVKEQNNRLVISVYNNGIGMSKEELNEARDRVRDKGDNFMEDAKIGMENVSYRLYRMFEDKVKFLIYSSPLKGTVITIQIMVS